MDNKAQTKEYFNRVAASYLDRYYTSGSGRYPNLKLRTDIVIQAVTDFVEPEGRVLDAGCGGGNLVAELARCGYCVHGLDLAPSMVEATRSVIGALPADVAERCDVRQGDIEALPYPDTFFDAAVASGVFEYLTTDQQALRELRRVLKMEGIVLISFRNRSFNTYSANSYTLRELESGQLEPLLESVISDIQKDARRIAGKAQDFYQDLQKAVGRLAQCPPSAINASQLAVLSDKQAKAFWEKTMERRQHTVAEVETVAREARFALEQVFFFHFHPLPPMVRELMPEVYDALALAMESFSDTRLGELLASGFVAMLRAIEA